MKIHKILLLLPLLALAACSDNDIEQTLSGDGKTPLIATALLNANGKASQTRAADKEFSTDGDELKVMLRHVTWTGKVQGEQDYAENTDAPKPLTSPIQQLVTFTAKGKADYNGSDEDILPFDEKKIGIDSETTNQAATLTASPELYWDDFSIGGKGDAKDIRTDNHYLQSYYGYCYNGGTPTEDLEQGDNKINGVIKWAVQTDQTSGFQTSDLLWSPAQKPVSYTHATSQTENHGQVVIPFLHAMSKVTINVIAGDGFTSGFAFNGTTVALKDVRLKCTATAPTATLAYPAKTEAGAKGNVDMKPGTGTGTRSFEAIIVPSILTVGNTFATITNMDGDTYNIPVTDKMVNYDASATDNKGWGQELDNADEDVDNGTAQVKPMTRAKINKGNGHHMRSGVHYVLNVTVSKTEVTVSATILDWDEVYAEGVGEIHFDNDIKTTGQIEGQMLKDNGFDVYMSANNSYGTRTTHLRYNKTTNKWKYDPVIYWQGGTAQYFRALSNVRADAAGTQDANESLIMENGRDALWGTTAAADGYTEGQAVDPRTGDVPLKFYHAMSKITFNLVDANADGDALAKLDLHGATIQLTNLATGGTLNLATGEITKGTIVDKTFSEDKGAVPSRMGYFAAEENGTSTSYDADVTLKDYVITPQTIGNDALVIITLADGTVYKAQLNLCTSTVVENGVESHPKVEEWKSGKSYIYTIALAKEEITFRALVEDWKEPEKATGNATMEWD